MTPGPDTPSGAPEAPPAVPPQAAAPAEAPPKGEAEKVVVGNTQVNLSALAAELPKLPPDQAAEVQAAAETIANGKNREEEVKAAEAADEKAAEERIASLQDDVTSAAAEEEGQTAAEGVSFTDAWDRVWKRFNEEGGGFVAAMILAFKLFFGVEEEEAEEAEGEEAEGEEAADEGEDGENPGNPENSENTEEDKTALDQLAQAKEENPKLTSMAEVASERYGLGPNGTANILAIVYAESTFDPNARNSDKPENTATGLGQFTGPTWQDFQKSLPVGDPLKGKPSTDPEAAFTAVAWNISRIATALNLDPNQDDFLVKIYLGHHEGVTGAKKMIAFVEKGGPAGTVSDPGRSYPQFGVDKVETYKDYATVIYGLAENVKKVAGLYQAQLASTPSS